MNAITLFERTERVGLRGYPGTWSAIDVSEDEDGVRLLLASDQYEDLLPLIVCAADPDGTLTELGRTRAGLESFKSF